ncbi:MAG TPA: CDP-diacylglycerol--glycerol-3-phosphate 3-phosphatidyltransferase [Terriglobia bacterium]|nr:CDP-diacylglycerol--glycerol-3-phosphate 3-phosphatidyltransferase [Terriglobia bacterium]
MNLPNFLTIVRIFLVPLLVVVLLTRFPNWEFVGIAIFLSAAVTDWLDGHLARRRQQITPLGVWLDPIADKLLVGAAFVALVEMQLAPAWMVVIIVGREVVVTALRNIALLRGFSVPVSHIGKAKMAVEVAAITALILGERLEALAAAGHAALWLAMGLALFSAVQYFYRFWTQLGEPPPRAAQRHPLIVWMERPKSHVSTEQ